MRTQKSKSEKHDNGVSVRFNEAESAAIQAACPPGEKIAPFIRQCALKHLDKNDSQLELLRKSVALIIGALSPDLSPEDAAALFDEHVLGKKGGGA